MKGKFTLLILILLTCPLYGQFKKTHSVIRDTFPDGKIKQITEVWTKETKKAKLYTYSKSTKKVITRYYENGKIWYRLTYNTSIGPDEVPCEELGFKQEEYWKNGTKKSFLKTECDCHKYLRKEWNEKGQLLNKTRSKIKRLY
jgi:antitoxin component YwqK of YwqJK toxin-antitoxin module